MLTALVVKVKRTLFRVNAYFSNLRQWQTTMRQPIMGTLADRDVGLHHDNGGRLPVARRKIMQFAQQMLQFLSSAMYLLCIFRRGAFLEKSFHATTVIDSAFRVPANAA